jgi:outer membrane lipoprotein-sorting protein
MRSKVLDDALKLQGDQKQQNTSGIYTRRTIMKSRITKSAAAAVIIIAVLTGIYQLTGSIDGAGVAWADVAETVSQICTFTYHTTKIGKDERTNYESITYVSGSKRRTDVYYSGKIGMTHYMLPVEQELIVILPDGKILERVQLNKEDMDEINRKADIRGLVQRFMSYSHKKLGRKTINGILTEGIEVDDTTLADGDPLKASLCKLWVDIETNLPVLFESDVVFENGTQRTTIVDKFEWNIELDDSDFVPNIPDDYTDANEKEKSKNSEHKTISKKELTEEDKETKAIVKEMVYSIFQACVDEDWEQFFKFMYYEFAESRVKNYEYLGGLKIVSIDDPFQHEGSSKWIIPYKVKLKDGKIREGNLYIGYFEKEKRYIVTGGLKE